MLVVFNRYAEWTGSFLMVKEQVGCDHELCLEWHTSIMHTNIASMMPNVFKKCMRYGVINIFKQLQSLTHSMFTSSRIQLSSQIQSVCAFYFKHVFFAHAYYILECCYTTKINMLSARGMLVWLCYSEHSHSKHSPLVRKNDVKKLILWLHTKRKYANCWGCIYSWQNHWLPFFA